MACLIKLIEFEGNSQNHPLLRHKMHVVLSLVSENFLALTKIIRTIFEYL